MNKERLSEWKSFNDYEEIVSIIKKGGLNDFVAGPYVFRCNNDRRIYNKSGDK